MKKLILFLLLAFSYIHAEYSPKDYAYLLGKTGLDDALMKMHFTLYGGYVKNTNLLEKKLSSLDPTTYEYGALKRHFSWEFDGMRLHELFFDNLAEKSEINHSSPLFEALKKEFGSFEKWKGEFAAMGGIRGIGWVALVLDLKSNRLFNIWINEHDLGHLANEEIVIVMDVFEHAYLTQFGLDRPAYIGTFLEHINWKEVNKRYDAAVSRRPH